MRKSYIILYLCILALQLKGQDIHFSQFYAAPLYLAPSYAGTSYATRVAANYRDQWPGIPSAFTTYSFAIDHNFSDLRSGVGLFVTSDTKGELSYSTTNVGLAYSYDIFARTNLHIRPGLQITYSMNGIDLGKIRTRDMDVLNSLTPAVTPDFESYKFVDLAASVLMYSNEYWFGLKIDHLMVPPQNIGSNERTPIKIDVFSGYKIRFGGRSMRPKEEHILVACNFRATAYFSQLDVGVMGVKRNIQLGFWYRGLPAIKKNPGSDAFILSLGYTYRNVTLTYSHDFTVSGLDQYSNGANEISLIVLLDKMNSAKKKRSKIKCPTFY